MIFANFMFHPNCKLRLITHNGIILAMPSWRGLKKAEIALYGC